MEFLNSRKLLIIFIRLLYMMAMLPQVTTILLYTIEIKINGGNIMMLELLRFQKKMY
jgi:hypothetical protein